MFCFNCGIKLKDDWKYCFNCGVSLTELFEDAENDSVNDGFYSLNTRIPYLNCAKMFESVEFPSLFEDTDIVEIEDNRIMIPNSSNFNELFKVVKHKNSRFDSITNRVDICIKCNDEDLDDISFEGKLYNSFEIKSKDSLETVCDLIDLRGYVLREEGIYFVKDNVFYFLNIEGKLRKIKVIENVISMDYNSKLNQFEFRVYKGHSQIAWGECRETCGGNFENYYDVYSVRTNLQIVKLSEI